ncbi:hypothetical protein DV096_19570 [Bradymonadaceae bacterium TMQ3]|nr:hypothetical protein DV096_19570 [Bradymonadaceae bacterium TMQ3]TXC68504.1 hypothetical protein FRC91_19355 [Bradymonadales bacterium TMQ1]
MTLTRLVLSAAAILMLSLFSAPALAQPALYPQAPDRSPAPAPATAPSVEAGEEPRFRLASEHQSRRRSQVIWQLRDRQTGKRYSRGDFYRVLGHPELGDEFDANLSKRRRATVLGPLLVVVSLPVMAISGFVVLISGSMWFSTEQVLAALVGTVASTVGLAYGAYLFTTRHQHRLTLLGRDNAQRLVDEANARGALFDAQGNARLRETPSSFRLSVAPYVRPTLGRAGGSGVAGGLGLRGSW